MAYFPEQPLKVTTADRVINKIPVANESDKSTLNANRVMYIIDTLLSGGYRNSEHAWSYAGVSPNDRPTISSVPAVKLGEKGFNTDFNGLEMYIGPMYGWLVLTGVWTVSTRPHETSLGANDLAPGSRGYNVDLAQFEFWDGLMWRSV